MIDLAYAMAPSRSGGGGGGELLGILPPLLIMFAIFYFLLIRPQQKKQKEHKEMLESIKEGDNVITSSGIYGTVKKVKDDVLTLQIAEKVNIKMLKSGITNKR